MVSSYRSTWGASAHHQDVTSSSEWIIYTSRRSGSFSPRLLSDNAPKQRLAWALARSTTGDLCIWVVGWLWCRHRRAFKRSVCWLLGRRCPVICPTCEQSSRHTQYLCHWNGIEPSSFAQISSCVCCSSIWISRDSSTTKSLWKYHEDYWFCESFCERTTETIAGTLLAWVVVSNICSFHPVEDSHFDVRICFKGWNHQPPTS